MSSPESFDQKKRHDESSNIETTANYEGVDSLLVIERLRNPQIKAQLIDLMYSAYEERAATGKPIRIITIDPETKQPLKNENGTFVLEDVPFELPTNEYVEKEIDKEIEEIATATRITFIGQEPSPNSIDLNWQLPSGEKPTSKQLSIIEAHEKGHVVRSYPAYGAIDPIRKTFLSGFDQSAVNYSLDDFRREQSALEPDITYEKAKENFFHYLFSPGELAERMSQLKNYFGMKGEEQFTKAHLDYARKHYIADTNFDNRMTQFFQAITPEKEDRFIGLMNTAGI